MRYDNFNCNSNRVVSVLAKQLLGLGPGGGSSGPICGFTEACTTSCTRKRVVLSLYVDLEFLEGIPCAIMMAWLVHTNAIVVIVSSYGC